MHYTTSLGHALDVRGCSSSQSLIRARQQWENLQPGELFRVLTDNEKLHESLYAFFRKEGACPQSRQDGEYWVIEATCQIQKSDISPTPDTTHNQPSRTHMHSTSGYMVVIKSKMMGDGDNDLGHLLLKGYINALAEINEKPSVIAFYNSGVQLAANGSGVEQALHGLQQSGVDIILCGACVDFFLERTELAVGRVSNMYEIAEKLATASHVVYP